MKNDRAEGIGRRGLLASSFDFVRRLFFPPDTLPVWLSTSRTRLAPVTSPSKEPASARVRPQPVSCPPEPRPFSTSGARGAGRTLARSICSLAAILVAALSLAATLAVRGAAVGRVGDIQLTVAHLDREAAFFTNVLAFREIHRGNDSGPGLEALTSLAGARSRHVRLQLGDEVVRLTTFDSPKGRPIPPDSRSHDHWFQHIAIVVSDMDRAYDHLRRHNVRHVSTGPQTLPEWNPNAGGIRAFYFRDPEDHVIEVIFFPPGKGNPKWPALAAARPEALFLGIDHTAIVVSETERSLSFYRDALGLRVAGGSENHGVEQEHLNQVFGARLRITALRAPSGPGIEFLEYVAPPGGRPLPLDAQVNDLVSWVTHLHGPAASAFPNISSLRRVSRVPGDATDANPPQAMLVRDPDGHLLQLNAGDASDDSGS